MPLGINRVTLSSYLSGKSIGDKRDQYERAGHLVGIHKNFRLLFPQNQGYAHRWSTARNKAFENLTQVEVVKKWGFAGPQVVRAHLDRARGT